jgi:ribosomal protein L40E
MRLVMRCSNCNAENGSKAKFCRQCGAMTARQASAFKTSIKRCGNCKIVAPSGAQYCTQCGESMMVTLIPGEASAKAARPRSRRYAFAATALMGLTLAVVGVHLFGGGSMLLGSPATTAGPSMAGAQTAPDASPQKPWLYALRGDLRKCEHESIFAQSFCREKAKFKHCKNRWGSVEECPKGDFVEEL